MESKIAKETGSAVTGLISTILASTSVIIGVFVGLRLNDMYVKKFGSK